MKDLSSHVKQVWGARDLMSKRIATHELIEASHATNETKKLSHLRVESMNMAQLDSFASNYSLSGEGMKVS
jgi:hypothetical protein